VRGCNLLGCTELQLFRRGKGPRRAFIYDPEQLRNCAEFLTSYTRVFGVALIIAEYVFCPLAKEPKLYVED
jgi:hypothetical protein